MPSLNGSEKLTAILRSFCDQHELPASIRTETRRITRAATRQYIQYLEAQRSKADKGIRLNANWNPIMLPGQPHR